MVFCCCCVVFLVVFLFLFFVLFCFLPQVFEFSFFLCLFNACFGFGVLVYPLIFTQAARDVISGDFLSCSVPIKRKSMWSFLLSPRSVASDCHLHSLVSFFACFKHFDIVQEHKKYLSMPLVEFVKSSHWQAGNKRIIIILCYLEVTALNRSLS